MTLEAHTPLGASRRYEATVLFGPCSLEDAERILERLCDETEWLAHEQGGVWSLQEWDEETCEDEAGTVRSAPGRERPRCRECQAVLPRHLFTCSRSTLRRFQ